MNTIEGVEVPRSLVALFNEEYSTGRWTGSLEAFCRVRYLIFRTEWARTSIMEPPSFLSWMRRIGTVDSATDSATNTQISNTLKNLGDSSK